MPDIPASSTQVLTRIAREAEVSKATVLRVLNGELKSNYPRVAKRHDQIRRLADQLNYRPSYVGRTVSRRRTFTIGLLYPKNNPMVADRYGATIHGLAVTLSQKGYDLALHAVSEEDQERTDLLLDRRFDGYVVHDQLTPEIRQAVERASLPCVTINAGRHEGMSSIDVDDVAGITDLTEHLLALGHRRIGLVSSRRGQRRQPHVSVWQREQGFRAVMKKAGLEAVVRQGNDGVAQELRTSASAPTAVIVHRAIQAAELLLEIKQAGLRVPDDVSLATFDDTAVSQLSDPPMTVMAVPFGTFGAKAAEVVMQAIEAGDAFNPQRVTLRQDLIVRKSTTPPKRG